MVGPMAGKGKHIQQRLSKYAARKFPGNKLQQNRYVYGTLTKRFGKKGGRRGKH